MREFENTQEWKKYFSERIAGLRMSKNDKLSSRKLSQDLNQCESYINKIETGRSLPSMEMFFKICEYFDITPAEFFSDNTDPHLKNELIKLYTAMSSDSRDLILQLARKLADPGEKNKK